MTRIGPVKRLTVQLTDNSMRPVMLLGAVGIGLVVNFAGGVRPELCQAFVRDIDVCDFVGSLPYLPDGPGSDRPGAIPQLKIAASISTASTAGSAFTIRL